jgi:hypothetical protein
MAFWRFRLHLRGSALVGEFSKLSKNLPKLKDFVEKLTALNIHARTLRWPINY